MNKQIKIISIFIVILIIIFIFLATYMKHAQNNNKISNHITIIGHRGAAGLAPENTLSAIREGIKYADRIEIDVHQSKDGKIVVMHDASVNRTTNGKGKIKNLEWSYLSQLDAGSWLSQEFQGEKIPLLEDVIDVVCPTKILLIEIKEGEYPDIEQNIVNIIREKNVLNRVIIQSFSTKILEKIHSIEPRIVLHKLFAKQIYIFGFPITLIQAPHFYNFMTFFYVEKYPYIQEYSIFHRFITKRFIDYLDKKTGKKMINIWVENNPERAYRLIEKGVDGIITDYPNRFK